MALGSVRLSCFSFLISFFPLLFLRHPKRTDKKLSVLLAFQRQQAVVLFGSNELPGIGSNGVNALEYLHPLPSAAE